MLGAHIQHHLQIERELVVGVLVRLPARGEHRTAGPVAGWPWQRAGRRRIVALAAGEQGDVGR